MDEAKEKDVRVQAIMQQRVDAIRRALEIRLGRQISVAFYLDREFIFGHISEVNPLYPIVKEMKSSGETTRRIANPHAEDGTMILFVSHEAAQRVARHLRIA